MQMYKAPAIVLLLTLVAVFALAGLGMTDEVQPAAAPGAVMSNVSGVAPAPLATHSIPPAK